MSRGHLDAAPRGAFLSLTIDGATALINKMVSNQSWGEERKTQKGMHTMKEIDLLSAKIDLLMKRLEERVQDKDAMIGTVQAMDSHMMCEVYGNVGCWRSLMTKSDHQLRHKRGEISNLNHICIYY